MLYLSNTIVFKKNKSSNPLLKFIIFPDLFENKKLLPQILKFVLFLMFNDKYLFFVI